MKKFSVIIAILLALMFLLLAIGSNVIAKQATCEQDNGWTKIDSDDLSQYPVASASAYCFKAGSDNSKGCDGGLFDSWPQPDGTCGLSHWSYYVAPDVSPTPSISPSPTASQSASPTPSVEPSPSPSPTPTPSVDPSPTPSPTPTVEQQVEDLKQELIEEYGEVPALGYK